MLQSFKQSKLFSKKRCVSCHGPDKDKGDLKLHTQNDLLSSKVIVAGNADKSSLYELISLPADHDDIMPPKGEPLTKYEVSNLKKWIDAGAKWPEGVILEDRSKEPKQPEAKMTAKTDAFKKVSTHNQHLLHRLSQRRQTKRRLPHR